MTLTRAYNTLKWLCMFMVFIIISTQVETFIYCRRENLLNPLQNVFKIDTVNSRLSAELGGTGSTDCPLTAEN